MNNLISCIDGTNTLQYDNPAYSCMKPPPQPRRVGYLRTRQNQPKKKPKRAMAPRAVRKDNAWAEPGLRSNLRRAAANTQSEADSHEPDDNGKRKTSPKRPATVRVLSSPPRSYHGDGADEQPRDARNVGLGVGGGARKVRGRRRVHAGLDGADGGAVGVGQRGAGRGPEAGADGDVLGGSARLRVLALGGSAWRVGLVWGRTLGQQVPSTRQNALAGQAHDAAQHDWPRLGL